MGNKKPNRRPREATGGQGRQREAKREAKNGRQNTGGNERQWGTKGVNGRQNGRQN